MDSLHHPASGDRSRLRALAWPVLVSIPLVLDVLLYVVARPFHQRVFEGELGLIELPTFIVLMVVVGIAGWGAFRTRGAARKVLGAMSLGALFWGGEEVDWGQTFFRWQTPAAWAATNYQKEENLHNTKGLLGTLTNQAPRFVLDVLTILAVLLVIPQLGRLRQTFRDRLGERWLVPVPAAAAPAALAIVASLINKAIHKQYKGFGETQELYIAIFLLTYAVVLIRAESARATETP